MMVKNRETQTKLQNQKSQIDKNSRVKLAGTGPGACVIKLCGMPIVLIFKCDYHQYQKQQQRTSLLKFLKNC